MAQISQKRCQITILSIFSFVARGLASIFFEIKPDLNDNDTSAKVLSEFSMNFSRSALNFSDSFAELILLVNYLLIFLSSQLLAVPEIHVVTFFFKGIFLSPTAWVKSESTKQMEQTLRAKVRIFFKSEN